MIYITGSSGFVGGSLANWLEHKGSPVVRIGRDAVKDSSLLPAGTSSSNVLIHCAWEGVLGSKRNDEEQANNILLSKRILHLAEILQIRHLIAFGSQAEYGPANCAVSEDYPLNPVTRYGETKVLCNKLLHAGCERLGIPLTWFRLFDPYGPGDRPEWFLPYVIQSALNDFSPELTECIQLWDYIYIDDVCACVETVLTSSSQARGGVYNLSSNQPVQLSEIVETIFRIVDPPSAKPLFGSVPFRDDQIYHLQGSNLKLLKDYGWQPHTCLNEGLIQTIAYEKSHMTTGS